MRVDLFDFDLPPELIALRPARPRDAARMLVVEGEGDAASTSTSSPSMTDRHVRDLPGCLRAGDVLVFNDTRVIPAQLEGRRGEARIGATLHKRIDLRRWQAFVRNAKRLKPGDVIAFPADVMALAEQRHDDGSWTLAFAGELLLTLEASAWDKESIEAAMKALGEAQGWSVKENFMLLRAIITGSTQSPPLLEAVIVLGKARTLDRVRRFIETQKRLLVQASRKQG